MKHLTVVVTHWDINNVRTAHAKAKEIYGKQNENTPFVHNYHELVSDIIEGVTNGYASFFIALDGSKEGWDTSDRSENAMNEFCDWLRHDSKIYVNYVALKFGGDDDNDYIVRSRDKDLVDENEQP